MDRQPLVSSTIASAGYDPQDQTLELEFISGTVYRYYTVPEEVFSGLLSAGSAGQFFDTNIKKAGYKFERVS
ncbi:MAG TPA: KTSC domain-containing protein [Anaerolineaceae bacterium]|nr:KTSC domain-containing protein [Anaerolineaceae bacterium]